MTRKLLAKRPFNGREVTIADHSRSLLEAVEAIYGRNDAPTPFSGRWLSFFGIEKAMFNRFLLDLRLAAIFHDIGKANDGFQGVLIGRGKQVIRHEHLSALLLWLKPMREWINNHREADFEIILSAVLSHHLKVDDGQNFISKMEHVDKFSVFTGTDDFREVLLLAGADLGVTAPDLSCYDGEWYFDKLDKKTLHEHLYREKKQRLVKDDIYRRLFLSVRASLIAVDASGSALVREGLSLGDWIRSVFGTEQLTAKDIEEKVLQPRIIDIERRSGSTFRLHDFQIAAGKLGPRALLLAGCGSGKTLAAWKWIERQTAMQPVSRVIFLYPTRATATEGFKDYVSWAGGEDAALLHGTSEYDLEGMFTSPADSRKDEDFKAQEGLFAIGYWPKRLFSATVDSFLSFMSYSYGSICMLPLLAESVVVVDEVHSFDKSMFTALEGFLRFFNVPVLCMTASLTSDRFSTLKDVCGLEVFPSDADVFADLERQADATRYIVQHSPHENVLEKVKAALQGKSKVLWVLNTVDRCQETVGLMEEFCKDRKIPLACYHSRFRLKDRKARHQEVINLFRNHAGAALVVTTQVCEMSLDLDADLLVTEIAPVPPLIQRMGRCCRVPLPVDRRGMVLVYAPSDEKPYKKDEMKQGEDFIRFLAEREEVSQTDLSNYLETMAVQSQHIEGGYTGFLDSGWFAMSAEESFREGADFTEDCILDSDLSEFLDMKRQKKPFNDLIVPVPRSLASYNPILGRHIMQAPSSHYSPLTGFHKKEVSSAG